MKYNLMFFVLGFFSISKVMTNAQANGTVYLLLMLLRKDGSDVILPSEDENDSMETPEIVSTVSK